MDCNAMKLTSKITLLCLFGSSVIHATNLPTISDTIGVSYWFLSGQVGGQSMVVSSARVNNNVALTRPFNQDIYTSSGSNASTLLGVQIGGRWQINTKWLTGISLGAQYQYFFETDVTGQVQQFSLPRFTNYQYQLSTATNLIVAHGKLHLLEYKKFSPFLQGGIGGAIHNTRNYTETALVNVTPRVSPRFRNHTNSEFAYILGAGIEYWLSQVLILSAAYQYSALGTLVSGHGTSTWSGEQLNFGNTDSSAFIFSLIYLFGAKQ